MIEAGGGLLWRFGRGANPQVILVKRPRYNDWSFPKGKLKRGESPLEGALREVREETGHAARAIGFAGVSAYETVKGLKLVHYWNMVVEQARVERVDENEIIKTVWLTPRAASARLTYAMDRAVLNAWAARVKNRGINGAPGVISFKKI